MVQWIERWTSRQAGVIKKLWFESRSLGSSESLNWSQVIVTNYKKVSVSSSVEGASVYSWWAHSVRLLLWPPTSGPLTPALRWCCNVLWELVSNLELSGSETVGSKGSSGETGLCLTALLNLMKLMTVYSLSDCCGNNTHTHWPRCCDVTERVGRLPSSVTGMCVCVWG